MKITIVGGILIIAAVIAALLILRVLINKQNPGTQQDAAPQT
jgi:hypothetical protein